MVYDECIVELINLMCDFRQVLLQFLFLNVVGVLWSYRDVVVKFFLELGSEIEKGFECFGIINNFLMFVLVKDGGDGFRDVFQYRERGDSF